jgi:hypothetical protein
VGWLQSFHFFIVSKVYVKLSYQVTNCRIRIEFINLSHPFTKAIRHEINFNYVRAEFNLNNKYLNLFVCLN